MFRNNVELVSKNIARIHEILGEAYANGLAGAHRKDLTYYKLISIYPCELWIRKDTIFLSSGQVVEIRPIWKEGEVYFEGPFCSDGENTELFDLLVQTEALTE